MSNKNMNFLPDDYLEKKAQQRTNVICLALFFVVMAGVAAGLVVTEKRQKEMTAREEQVRKSFAQASESLKQMEVLESKKKQMMDKASISASLIEAVPRSLLLATITNHLPAGVSLLDFSLISKVEKQATAKRKVSRNKRKKSRGGKSSTPAAAAKPTPEKVKTTIGIEGIAGTDLQVAKFISQLNRSVLFEQVNLVFSEEHTVNDEALRRFKIMIVLDPAAKATPEDVALARDTHVTGM